VTNRFVRRLEVLILIGLAACGSPGNQGNSDSPSAPTLIPCSEVIPGCSAKRSPDIELRGKASDGALQSVGGFDTSGIMSFDDALRRDAQLEYSYRDAKTVRVVLGSAAAKVNWAHGPLYYAIDWGGLCMDMTVTSGGSPNTCAPGTFGTVIDARTGAFIVSG
jgi:hypothetical protein